MSSPEVSVWRASGRLLLAAAPRSREATYSQTRSPTVIRGGGGVKIACDLREQKGRLVARTQRETECVLCFWLCVGGSSRTWGKVRGGPEGRAVEIRWSTVGLGGRAQCRSHARTSRPLCNFFPLQNSADPSATEGFLFFFCVVGGRSRAPSWGPSPRLPSATSVAGPCGLAGATQPGPHVSPPTQLPTPESKPSGAEVRRRHTLERVTARGEGNAWPGANLLCTLSLCARSLALLFSQSLSHYFVRPSPHPPHFVRLSLAF